MEAVSNAKFETAPFILIKWIGRFKKEASFFLHNLSYPRLLKFAPDIFFVEIFISLCYNIKGKQMANGAKALHEHEIKRI